MTQPKPFSPLRMYVVVDEAAAAEIDQCGLSDMAHGDRRGVLVVNREPNLDFADPAKTLCTYWVEVSLEDLSEREFHDGDDGLRSWVVPAHIANGWRRGRDEV